MPVYTDEQLAAARSRGMTSEQLREAAARGWQPRSATGAPVPRDYYGEQLTTHELDPYMNQLAASRALQQREAERAFAHAGDLSAIQAQQARGQALQQTLGGRELGGLAARQAIQQGGLASYGAGVQGVYGQSEARLAAADAYMQAQQQEALQERMMGDVLRQRMMARRQAMREIERAQAGQEARKAQASQAIAGAMLGAGSSMAAAGADYSSQQEQGQYGRE